MLFASHNFLEDLAMVLSIAAIITVVCQRLHQPVVVGYLIAGMIVGPHLPVPLLANEQRIHVLSELGVILLIFSIGLEFSVRRLVRLAPTAGFVTVVQVSLMMWLGYVAGRVFGWSELESLYAGAIVAISSTTIVAKAFAEERVPKKLNELVFGVLLFEDLVAILLIAVFTALSAGGGISVRAIGATAARLGAFLAGLTVVGILTVPRMIRSIARLGRDETLLVASIGICFAAALAAEKFGYSVALGAFLAGSIVAESGVAAKVEHLIEPVRDMFGAVFFVSVGMLIDPEEIVQHWQAVAVLTVLVIAGKVTGVSLGAFLVDGGVPTAVRAGMSLAQIGEFSFIIAGVGLAMGATREFLYTVAVAVSAITTFATPLLIRASAPVATFVDRRLPLSVQVFTALYASWIESLRAHSGNATLWSKVRRPVLFMIVDSAALVAIAVASELEVPGLFALVEARTKIPAWLGEASLAVAVLAVSTPFFIGIVLSARTLGATLAEQALPRPAGRRRDPSGAARRALAVALEIAIAIVVGGLTLVLAQPFFPPLGGAAFLGIGIGLVAAAFWRNARNLQEQVRAGARIVTELFADQHGGPGYSAPETGQTGEFLQTVSGLGTLFPVRLDDGSPATGKTLAEVDLRGRAGATVIAITRGAETILLPGGGEVLRANDTLALAGTEEAIEAARRILAPPSRP